MSTDRPTGFIGASNVPDTISEQRCGQALLSRKPSHKRTLTYSTQPSHTHPARLQFCRCRFWLDIVVSGKRRGPLC